MTMKAKFTAILRFEEDMVVALSPDLDIASQDWTGRFSSDHAFRLQVGSFSL